MSAVKIIEHDTWAEIVLNRPKSKNSINAEWIQDLNTAIERAGEEHFRAILLRGEGDVFCAGGDIRIFGERIQAGEHITPEEPAAMHKAFIALRQLQKPVLAAVHGACAGAGMSLMLACDLAYAASGTKFFLAYSTIGLSPDGGATHFLPRHVGIKKAMELLITPRPSTAQDMLELGLINQIHSDESLLEEARNMTQMLAMGPTLAYGKLKTLLNQTQHTTFEEQLDLEAQLFSASSQTEDFREGIAAFVGKRMPQFKGK